MDFSLKTRKYANQTKSERVRDHPRLVTTSNPHIRAGLIDPKEIRTLSYIFREHNRAPAAFDYKLPQDFYSTHPEIDFDAFVVLGSKQRRGVEDGDYLVHD